MNKLPLLLRHLGTQVTDELTAQRRLLGLLEVQEAAIATAQPSEMVPAGEAVEAELATAATRARHRDVLLKGFANLWELKPGTLTFSSVIERAGDAAADMVSVRNDLRSVTSEVTRRARNIRTLASAHQRLTMEILEVLFENETSGSVAAGGVLVDAEA